MAPTDIDLLPSCVSFSLQHIHAAEERTIDELQTSAATSLVTALRMCRLHRALVAVGMLSLFESLLQDEKGWVNAFTDLDTHLRGTGKVALADRFMDFKDAVNVLKHGKGRSYERLLKKKNTLDFEIKDAGSAFFDEGDVSKVAVLIDVDDKFLNNCAETIHEASRCLQ